ncbi:DNA repair protein RecO, partial [Anaeromassilibacillus sp. SJQ-1]|uniref:DNA repair protein RecO n=1 Tax=Anaeromassilibacillus sp. SJQ-1 TaxID=3375419 RepID=UPI0039894D99
LCTYLLVRLCEADINQNNFHTRVSFRIYRETLSRFSCAASPVILVLTREEGVLRAFARRAKLLRSSKLSATQLLCYSRFLIYKGRDKYIIDDAQPVEVFFDLRRDIGSLSLAQYFCELAGALAPQEAGAGDFLRLLLRAFFYLSKATRPHLLIKAAVEMRMLSLAGYMPDLVCCAGCACYEAETMFISAAKWYALLQFLLLSDNGTRSSAFHRCSDSIAAHGICRF